MSFLVRAVQFLVDDLTALTEFTEETTIDQLARRYGRDQIYVRCVALRCVCCPSRRGVVVSAALRSSAPLAGRMKWPHHRQALDQFYT